MTTYPLPTLAATVGPNGISAPSFADIYASLQASFASIYGSDGYIDPDSQDGQMLAVFAEAINDCNNTAIAVYNQFSPATSQGAGLSSVVKINGIRRQTPSNSTAPLLVTGTVGTVINNGIASDGTNSWNLPSSVTIPGGGSITVTGTCQTAGAITAASGTITTIKTPVRGWQLVSNTSDATPGAPVEVDGQLRQRQAQSVALPAITPVEATLAQIKALPGVSQAVIYENPTDTTDGNGIPKHSIAAVVVGGDAQTIANTIYQTKTPGGNTYGTTTETVINNQGLPIDIRFTIPTDDTILVHVSIHALAGYAGSVGTAIQNAVADFVNTLGIGALVSDGYVQIAQLTAAAVLPASEGGNTYRIGSVLASISPASPGSADVAIDFDHLPVLIPSNVTIIIL